MATSVNASVERVHRVYFYLFIHTLYRLYNNNVGRLLWRQELKALEWKSLEGENESGAGELRSVELWRKDTRGHVCFFLSNCVCGSMRLQLHWQW